MKKTIQLGLIYDKKTNKTSLRKPLLYSLLDYIDNNIASDLKDQKLVIRHCFFFYIVVIL